MSAVLQLTDTERAALATRYPGVFNPPLRQRLIPILVVAAIVGMLIFGFYALGFSFDRLGTGARQLGWFIELMFPPNPGDEFSAYLQGMVQTLSIAFLGTLLASVLALPFGILAAKNVVPAWLFHFLTRRFLDTVRSVDTLIWALIWINVVGLGPFAGALAIMSSDFGALGKIFSETIEAAERKAVEGVRSTGGNALHEIRFGLLPQVLPVIAGQMLYFFESNTRSATIIGIVGAGGIGLALSEQIRINNWQHVSFIVLMILVVVAVIDQISSRLRAAMMGKRGS